MRQLLPSAKYSWMGIKYRARPGFEPGTSRTLSENHTPRPTSQPLDDKIYFKLIAQYRAGRRVKEWLIVCLHTLTETTLYQCIELDPWETFKWFWRNLHCFQVAGQGFPDITLYFLSIVTFSKLNCSYELRNQHKESFVGNWYSVLLV